MKEFCDILLDEAEQLVAIVIFEFLNTSGDNVVKNHDVMIGLEQAVSEVRAQKARATRDQAAHSFNPSESSVVLRGADAPRWGDHGFQPVPGSVHIIDVPLWILGWIRST